MDAGGSEDTLSDILLAGGPGTSHDPWVVWHRCDDRGDQTRVKAMNTGVYVIEHIASGKKYVGSAAKSFSKRWREHRHSLRKGTHHSPYLQHAWDKYGEDAFVWRIVKRTSPEEAIESEQAYIDLHQAGDPKRGYNNAPIAGSCLGVKHSDAARANMSAAQKGVKHGPFTAEHCAKISAAGMGRKVSAETRAKMSAAHMGNKCGLGYKHTLEQLAKRTGKKHTAERCAKMSAAMMGNKNAAKTE